LSNRPATAQEIVDVDLPRPRDLDSRGYLEKRDRIFRVMEMSPHVSEIATAKRGSYFAVSKKMFTRRKHRPD
jgi:hypothetical protein